MFFERQIIPQNIVQCPIPEEIEILCTDAMLPNPLGCTLRLSALHNSFCPDIPCKSIQTLCASNFFLRVRAFSQEYYIPALR